MIARVGERFQLVRERLLHGVHLHFVSVGKDRAGVFQLDEQLGVIVHIEPAQRQVNKSADLAAGKVRRAALKIQVIDGVDHPHDRISGVGKAVYRILVVLWRYRHHAADVALAELTRISNALVVRKRHASRG